MPGATLVATRRTPWVRGPSNVIDAMVLSAVTLDNDVYFERVVPYAKAATASYRSVVSTLGQTIDTVIDNGEALAAAFVQDTDASGLLHNYMEFTVAVPDASGNLTLTDTVLVSMQTIWDGGLGVVESALATARDNFVSQLG